MCSMDRATIVRRSCALGPRGAIHLALSGNEPHFLPTCAHAVLEGLPRQQNGGRSLIAAVPTSTGGQKHACPNPGRRPTLRQWSRSKRPCNQSRHTVDHTVIQVRIRSMHAALLLEPRTSGTLASAGGDMQPPPHATSAPWLSLGHGYPMILDASAVRRIIRIHRSPRFVADRAIHLSTQAAQSRRPFAGGSSLRSGFGLRQYTDHSAGWVTGCNSGRGSQPRR